MINIRPASDLRNKYQEIEELVLKEDEVIYLTKNGYGSMVVMSLEKYSDLIEEIELERELNEKNENSDIEEVLNKKDSDSHNMKYLTYEEEIPNGRKVINEKK